MCEQDPSTNKMNSKVTIILEELSQILASNWDFSFSGRTHFGNSQKFIYLFGNDRRPKSHELQKDSPCQTVKEAEKLGTTSDRE
jgi:hypothetical protein